MIKRYFFIIFLILLTVLNLLAGSGEPCLFFIVEVWRYALEDGAVVCVQPLRFFVGQHLAHYRRGVDRAERERLKL